jgi:ribosome modulation factor
MACTNNSKEDDQHWRLESLNKVYQQGYMAGLTERHTRYSA